MFHKTMIMEKTRKIVFIVLMCLLTAPLTALAAGNDGDNNGFDWTPVMEAIIEVESNGDTKAVKGNSAGAMQITPILVKECNQILKKRKSKKRYKLSDRFNLAKSKEMFLLFQQHFNPANDVEKAIRSWNGGLHYSVRKTQRYLERVRKAMR